MKHRRATEIAVSYLLSHGHEIAGNEVRGIYDHGVMDAVGVTHPDLLTEGRIRKEAYDLRLQEAASQGERPNLISYYTSRRSGKQPARKLSVIECKVSSDDLIQDLSSGKLLRYETSATHCYLQITADAVQYTSRPKSKEDKGVLINGLEVLGLPSHWGVLWAMDKKAICIRPPRKIQAISEDLHGVWALSIGRSLSYKITRTI